MKILVFIEINVNLFFSAYTRVGGNKKGVFTRNRQPKAAAHHLRKRYFSLAKTIDNSTMPSDLFLYVIDDMEWRKPFINDEL